MRLAAVALALASFSAISSAAPIDSDHETRSVLDKRPVVQNDSRIGVKEPILVKRPIVQNDDRIGVKEPILAKRPVVQNDTRIGVKEPILAKRPIIQNKNRISVKGPVLQKTKNSDPFVVEKPPARVIS
ncbi:hypothetical protein B0H13DRAFT_748972 [Mycena leptocephala]|nr:hypothetical protein B0H13DRAFT_748972 [Mycena leptocephala]